MVRASAWVVAAALHLGVPAAGLAWLALSAEAWPEPPIGGIICIWPVEWFNPLSLAQGARQAEVDALFGVSATAPVAQSGERCVRYRYSRHLSYTVLFRGEVADWVTLTPDAHIPEGCRGRSMLTVQAPRRAWYPERLEPPRTNCGCWPRDNLGCAAGADEQDDGDDAP